jgi:DNA polymerase-3 subunit epsilon
MKALVFDTETTGLPLFDQPSSDPRQPHIAQLAALLVDLDTYEVRASLDLIVRPDGWEIPSEVAAIHGITTMHAMDVGVPESLAVQALIELWRRAGVRIGHNEQFDARILRIALHRFEHVHPDLWRDGEAECTQRLSTPILKLPPTEKMRAAGRMHYKSPNLREAYRHFTGEDLAGAHSAMVDAQACLRVDRGIRALNGELVA